MSAYACVVVLVADGRRLRRMTGYYNSSAPRFRCRCRRIRIAHQPIVSLCARLRGSFGWLIDVDCYPGYYNSSALGSPVALNVATNDPTQSLRSSKLPSVRVNLAAGATA